MENIMFKWILSFFLLFSFAAKAETLTIISWNSTTLPAINAKILSKYIQKYHPDITDIEYKVVPGAGGISVANYLYNVAPKDGNTIGIFPRTVPLKGFIGDNNIKFDPKKFTWIGSSSDGRKDVNLLISRKPYEENLIIGDTNSSNSSIVELINKTTNLKFKTVLGYKDIPSMRFSLDSKEIDGYLISYSGYKLLDLNRAAPIVQYNSGKEKHPDLPNVPTLFELAKNEESKKIIQVLELSNTVSRPFVAPPDIPKEKAFKLRQAFEKAVNDPDYKLESEKHFLVVNFINWQQIESIIEDLSKVDKEILKNISD
jgi:tripartite-type tricarboxylate transporter receptor subunit TctC